MRGFLRRIFQHLERHPTNLAPVPVSKETLEERERALKELEKREHDATNRLHILEWQYNVQSRKSAEQKEKDAK
jgi:hypothetical protein